MNLFDRFLSLFFPKQCLACKASCERLACSECLDSSLSLRFQCCYVCGKRRALGSFCDFICSKNFYFDGLISVYVYQEDALVRKLISTLKYRFSEEAGAILAEKLAQKLRDCFSNLEMEMVIVPVPIDKSRLRFRGFNQAELLAKIVLKNIDGYRNLFFLDAIEKIKKTKQQAKLKEEERVKNLRGAFRVKQMSGKFLKNKTVILVDDVITTGSTLNECAKVLKSAGAGKVFAATVARSRI